MSSIFMCVLYVCGIVLAVLACDASCGDWNLNCNVKDDEYICTFQTGKLDNLKSFFYQTYDTGKPRNNANFQEGYTYLEAVNSFYKFYKKPKTWYKAKQVCAQDGAILIFPENSDEAKAVTSFWNPTSNDYLWVGISDLETEGDYVTVDGRSISEVYEKWMPYQPGRHRDNQDCVNISKNSKYSDVLCDNHYSFVCKRSLLQNIQLDSSSVIGALLDSSAMKTKLIFELELFDNNTSVHVVTSTSKKLQSDKLILTTKDGVKNRIASTLTYSETTEVKFSCEEYKALSKYLFVALINTTEKKVHSFNETQISRKFKMADNGSTLCCLYYVYGPTNDGREFQIRRYVRNKNTLKYKGEVQVPRNLADEKAESNTLPMLASLSCVAVILAVIITVLWKCYWTKCNQQSGAPQLPINEPSDPFYLNILFRRECDRELAEIEEHVYDEIGDRVYDELRNQ